MQLAGLRAIRDRGDTAGLQPRQGSERRGLILTIVAKSAFVQDLRSAQPTRLIALANHCDRALDFELVHLSDVLRDLLHRCAGVHHQGMFGLFQCFELAGQ
jgi:hypothetical protein